MCQADQRETVSSATETGILKLTAALQQRKDDVWERLKDNCNQFDKLNILWHRNCYAKYTSARNIKHAKKGCFAQTPAVVSQSKAQNEELPASRSVRSQSSGMDWSLCMFCQRKTHKKVKKLFSGCC